MKWFNDGTVLAYKLKYPNGAVDVFKGWVSSLGKAIPSTEVITRTVKITNNGRPSLEEDNRAPVVAVTGVSLDKAALAVAVGGTASTVVSVQPAGATDKSWRVATSDPGTATVTADATTGTLTVKGVAVGTATIVVMTTDGAFIAQLTVTVSAA